MSDISGQTVERWFVIYKFNNYKFPLSEQSKNTVYKDFNPFSTYNCEGKTVRDNEDVNYLPKVHLRIYVRDVKMLSHQYLQRRNIKRK